MANPNSIRFNTNQYSGESFLGPALPAGGFLLTSWSKNVHVTGAYPHTYGNLYAAELYGTNWSVQLIMGNCAGGISSAGGNGNYNANTSLFMGGDNGGLSGTIGSYLGDWTFIIPSQPESDIDGWVFNAWWVYNDTALNQLSISQYTIFPSAPTVVVTPTQLVATSIASLFTSPYTTNAATASGAVLNFASTQGMFAGQSVTGANIPGGATISSVNSGGTFITLSASVTGAGVANGATVTVVQSTLSGFTGMSVGDCTSQNSNLYNGTHFRVYTGLSTAPSNASVLAISQNYGPDTSAWADWFMEFSTTADLTDHSGHGRSLTSAGGTVIAGDAGPLSGTSSGPTTGSPPVGSPNTAAYNYWRINVTATRATDTWAVSISELKLTTSLGGTNLCTGGTAFSTTHDLSDPRLAADAFDGSTTTFWASQDTTTTSTARLPQALGYQFGSSVANAVTHVYITAAGGLTARPQRAPRDFNVEASNDGVHWTTIMNVVEQPAWADSEQRIFPLLVNTPGVYANTLYVTSGSTWTVPSDWDPVNNIIEAIGGGGASGDGSSSSGGGAGGGGGAYAKVYSAVLTPGSSIGIQVGAGATAQGAAGTDTWLQDNNTTTILLAKGGLGGASKVGGLGGASVNSIGYVKYAGGSAGDAIGSGSGSSSSGGGGGAGPLGVGGLGGAAPTTANWPGGGGGGNGEGTPGSAPTGTGAGGVGGSPAGGAGGIGAGTSGGTGTEWDSSHGSGGGGGGAGRVTAGQTPGKGGLYGGGGGGPDGSSSLVGSGANGIIVISYGIAAAVVYYLRA